MQKTSLELTMTFWIVVEWFWIAIECFLKAHNHLQKYLLQNSCFLLTFKNMQKQVHKGYPLAGPCIASINWNAHLQEKTTFLAHLYFSISFYLYVWLNGFEFWIVIESFSKAQAEQTFTDSKTLA